MRHHLLSPTLITTTTTMSPPSYSLSTKPKKNPTHPHHPTSTTTHSTPSLCTKHTPSATLDLLILILVLFSGTFLITSYFTYLTHSLSLLLPPTLSLSSTLSNNTNILYYLSLSLFLIISIFSFNFFCGFSKKCGKVGCKGLKKAVEFDLKMQGEECLRSGGKEVREINEMPWKGGSEGNPDYECLRAELKKMAPPNGRAVLLFRAKCGCPVAKLEGWGPKRGRRHKKILALNGGGDHR